MTMDTIIAILAFVVGLCALSVSIWQGFETRKNYRLSVTPHIEILKNKTVHEDFTGVSIHNRGIGPGIITSVLISMNGIEYDFISNATGFILELGKELPLSVQERLLFFEFDKITYLSVGQCLPVIYLKDTEISKGDSEVFINSIINISISIRYQSIYGNLFDAN